MGIINAFVDWMNSWLWSPYLLPIILIGGGIFFTIRTGLVQIRLFPEMFKVVMEKPANKDGVSSFGALMVSTASRVGTGNIIGVCTAIVSGGPGAIFWMWITAILGGANAFVESTLAQIYKKKDREGNYYGGPSFYMQDALHARWLGVLFAILIIITYAVGYNMLAAYNLQSTFATFSFYKGTSTAAIIGVVLAVLFAMCVLGGAKKLINITGWMVPVMGTLYVAISLIVLVMNGKNLGAMFGMIFSNAFDFKAIFGGFAGSCIMLGLKRGLYSNEAGMGSAPNAAARADVAHPVKQGLVQSLSVFIDTLLICTATAFMCLSTLKVAPTDFLGADGAADAAGYVQACLGETLGGIGPVFIAVSMSLFAFTTLIGNYSYCESCFAFILKRALTKTEATVFRIVATVLVFLGTITSAALAWNTADMMQGLMVLTNIPSIVILSGVACKCLKDYTDQKKAGKDPVFKAANIGLSEDEVECWK
ncbi:MAG: alanine:cation symporter family protein [Clostridiales bacterium]|nr:alanine:cation symporter family protein [Candidatus Crickella equi]